MAGNKITIELKCNNIAPIRSLTREIKSNSLKMGIFANNGSGKTFLSRLFRLVEKQNKITLDENGKSPTDMLLTIGQNKGLFSFKITSKEGSVKEDFSIPITKGELPVIPETRYIYHTFNQDYVEQNIRKLGFEKDSDISGYILGKANIDLKDEKDKLLKIEKEGKVLSEQVEREINSFVSNKIANIANVKRLSEYALLKPKNILSSANHNLFQITKSIDELIADYDKIKSVPEHLADIPLVEKVSIDLEILNELFKDLKLVFSLSSLSEGFKQAIKSKQTFIEQGMDLLSESKSKICPFCEQSLQEKALLLIDNYTKYLKDSEAVRIKRFRKYVDLLLAIITLLDSTENTIIKRINKFNEYKTKYIPSSEGVQLISPNIQELQVELKKLMKLVEIKISDISKPILIENSILDNIKKFQFELNEVIDSNNNEIKLLNSKKNQINEESKSVRRAICKRTYNYLIETHEEEINKIHKLREEWKTLTDDIKKKEEQKKTPKKAKVASTIKNVLNYFFSNKYQFDEETFNLVFDDTPLENNQVKDVLSEGEKNIVAFAYYIGDTHLKVNRSDDYKRLFFIIDDPISSMDFTHVYTLCGVIRDIRKIITDLNRDRLIIFTHSNEFMRILIANNIINKSMLLKRNELKDFNNNLTVPYISHLIDIYNIARKGEKPNHTTANSIRHIIETLAKFQNIEVSNDSITNYIKINIPNDIKTYTLINDLSHGGWRNEQLPITEDDFKKLCETIIKHIERNFKGQISYCKKIISSEF